MGEHTPDAAREYFESVNFEITSAKWYAMGRRDPSGENVYDMEEYKDYFVALEEE